jgi:hypothetical protein
MRLLVEDPWIAESNQANANFGSAVASAGDVNGDGHCDAIVGASGYANGQSDEGRAFLYLGSAAGLALSPAWTAESDQMDALFGTSVASAGDVDGDGYGDVIVGAPGFDNDQTDEGRAFVYHGSAAGLAALPAWTGEADQATARFGVSVATAGDVNGDGYSDVIVGADFYDNFGGRAFVYLGSAAGLAASPAWTVGGSAAGTEILGRSVATAGDVDGDGYDDVIVGAMGYDNGQTDEGRALVYLGSAAGLGLSPAWTAEGGLFSASFGWSVGTAGDVNGDGYCDVIVGAPGLSNGQSQEGRAAVYLGSAFGLAATPAWSFESNVAGAELGSSVATAGDVDGDGYSDVIVGARELSNDQTEEGRAHIFLGGASGLATGPAWSAEGNQASAFFGTSVAFAGDADADGYSDVLVGALGFDNGQTNEGRAYLYSGCAGDLPDVSDWQVTGSPNSALGSSVASARDVDGDGYSDLLVGAAYHANGQANEGRASLYLGSATGLSTTPGWSYEGEQTDAFLGACVAAGGDVNGDGYGDVIIGADGHDNGEVDEGRAYVFLGSATGLATSPAWVVEADRALAHLGYSAASAGDVNGDGYGDVIVGAFGFTNGETEEGAAFVYLGSAGGLSSTPVWSAEGGQAFANFGGSVAGAGDVDGDGYGDVIVGSFLFDQGELDEGRVFVYRGSSLGLASTPTWTLESDHAGAGFGFAVASAGDANGDGRSDVLVGAPWFDAPETDEGIAALYAGSPGGFTLIGFFERDEPGKLLGHSVAGAGDVNGDGLSDVLVSSPQPSGESFLYLGRAPYLLSNPVWSASGGDAASAGDVNGDTYGDVVGGDAEYSSGAGRALVYHGNEGGGLDRACQQRRASGSAPIALLGRTAANGLFRLNVRFSRSLAGFSWASPEPPMAHLEWEVEPLGRSFDGMGIERSPGQALVPGSGTLVFDELATTRVFGPRLRRAGGAHRWRARIATSNPLFPHTHWFSLPGNGLHEAKLITRP